MKNTNDKTKDIDTATTAKSKRNIFATIWAYIKNNYSTIILFLILLFIQQLSWSGNMILGKDGVTLFIPIDHKIPLISEFIYVYYLAFPLVIFAFFWIAAKDKKHCYNIWLTAIISFAISGLFYLFFQTQMVKPELTPTTLSDRLLINTWNACKPINCFPSQHAIMALLLILAYYNQKGTTKVWFRIFNYICAILILLATVFLKQHFIVDIFASIAIVIPVYIIVKVWNFGGHMDKKMTYWATKKQQKTH